MYTSLQCNFIVYNEVLQQNSIIVAALLTSVLYFEGRFNA
jgi:hypothetical protein